MATAADKKRWDSLHEQLEKAEAVKLEYEIQLGSKYGHNFQRSWLSSAQRKKLETLQDRVNKVGDKIYELLERISPRDWSSGVPSWWVRSKLTWEDAIRPANEQLSVVVPGSYGGRDGYIKEKTMPRTRETSQADFDDEDTVLADMAKALDIDADELKIKESHLTSFGAGTVYEVRSGREEYSVVEDEDAARELALAIVKQDLEEEPGNFNKDFIEQHINMSRLKRDLESDVQNMAEEDLREMSDRQFWKTAANYIDVPDEDEDGELPDPEDFIDEVAQAMTEERLKDPMAYLEEMYGDETIEKAIEIAGIDVNAAAEDAVDTDGEGHFLSHYDSETHTTPSGFVYWRDN